MSTEFNMDDNLEEIIKIAWKAAPGNTDYYLGRYIVEITSQLNKVLDSQIECDDDFTFAEDARFEDFYNGLLQREKLLRNKLNKLNRLVSLLRGS